jgi:hypothetical protein
MHQDIRVTNSSAALPIKGSRSRDRRISIPAARGTEFLQCGELFSFEKE